MPVVYIGPGKIPRYRYEEALDWMQKMEKISVIKWKKEKAISVPVKDAILSPMIGMAHIVLIVRDIKKMAIQNLPKNERN